MTYDGMARQAARQALDAAESATDACDAYATLITQDVDIAAQVAEDARKDASIALLAADGAERWLALAQQAGEDVTATGTANFVVSAREAAQLADVTARNLA